MQQRLYDECTAKNFAIKKIWGGFIESTLQDVFVYKAGAVT